MRTVWMIWIRGGDGFTWLADAWDDDTQSENGAGWKEALAKADSDARANDGVVRVQCVHIPQVDALFNVPSVTAEVEQ